MSSSAKNLSTTTQPLLINDGDADGHRSTPKYKSSKRYLSSRHMSGKLATIKKSDDLEDMERRKQCSGYDFEPYEEVLTAEQRADLMSDSMLSGDDSDADDIRSKDPEAPSNPDEDMYRKLDTKEKTPLVKRVLHEIAAILWLAIPISASLFIDNALSTLTTVFLGHMGARELAAGSLGLTLTNTTGWTLGNGLLTALDTQASHAFGAGKKRKLGVITERAAIIITLFCIPIGVAWCFTEEILVAIKCMLPGLVPAMWYECLRRHLQAMNITLPSTFIVLVSIPSELAYLFLSIYVFELGLVGCPIAVSLMYTTQFLMLAAYVLGRKDLRQTWPGCLPRDVFRGWWRFIKLAIPSAIMSCLEGWGFDIMSFFVGWLGTVPLAVHSALINTYYLMYMIPSGFSYASTTRVGVLLGSLRPGRARLSFVINMGLTLILELIFAVVLLAAGRQIGGFFCTDPAVIALYVKVVPFCSFLMFTDTFQISGGAALRGLGLQKYGMVINFVAFYVFSIPIGYALALPAKLGVYGIWSGLVLSDILSGGAFMVLLFCIVNWKKQAIAIAHEEEETKKQEDAARARILVNQVDDNLSNGADYDTMVIDNNGVSEENPDKVIASTLIADDDANGETPPPLITSPYPENTGTSNNND